MNGLVHLQPYLFHFQFPIQIAQVTILVPLMGTISIYMPNQTHVISPFSLVVHPPFLSTIDTLQDCPLPSSRMGSTSTNA